MILKTLSSLKCLKLYLKRSYIGLLANKWEVHHDWLPPVSLEDTWAWYSRSNRPDRRPKLDKMAFHRRHLRFRIVVITHFIKERHNLISNIANTQLQIWLGTEYKTGILVRNGSVALTKRKLKKRSLRIPIYGKEGHTKREIKNWQIKFGLKVIRWICFRKAPSTRPRRSIRRRCRKRRKRKNYWIRFSLIIHLTFHRRNALKLPLLLLELHCLSLVVKSPPIT